MGYKTEINYILKCSSPEEGAELVKNLQPGATVVVTKSGHRTFVLDSPIMVADHKWNIVGMVKIEKAEISKSETKLTATILTVFSKSESKIVSKLIQDAEKLSNLFN